MADKVTELEQLLQGQPQNPLRPAQIQGYDEELDRLDRQMKAPAYVGADRGVAAKRHRELSQMVETQRPRPLSGDRVDQVNRLQKEVLETVIRPAMLPQEVMRRNPSGAVGQFLRTEGSRPIKRAIQAYKRARLALEPQDGNVSVENYRPSLTGDPVTSFMVNAQIPGHFGFGPTAKANWPAGMPAEGTVETPLKTARKREWTEEQRQAAGARLAAGRAAKAAQTVTEPEPEPPAA